MTKKPKGEAQSNVTAGIRRSDDSVDEREREREVLLVTGDQHLRRLAELSPGLMAAYHLRADGTMCMPYTSPRIWDLFGLRPEDVVDDATPLLERTHADDVELVRASLAESARTMTPWRLEFRVVHPTRGELWLESSTNPAPHPDGGVVWYGFVHDITTRRRAEQALALTSFALDHVHEAAYLVDETGRFVYVNREASRLLGYTREELLRLTVSDIDPIYDRVRWPDHWEANRQAGTMSFESVHRQKNGGVFPIEIQANYFEFGGGSYILALARDITQRKRAEEALRNSEQRFRQLTESIDEAFWLANPDRSEFVYVSPAYSSIWGRTCESLCAAPSSWLDAVHEEDRERVRGQLAELDGGRVEGEYRIVRPDGALRWIHERVFPIRDAAGQIYRIVGVSEDVTSRRELEEQYRQSQKMEAVGQLAGGIAHDFNNMLAVIQMQTSLLLDPRSSRDPSTIRRGLEGIQDAAMRAASLTRQLLTFSRRMPKTTQGALDLREVVEDMAKMLRRLLGEDVDLDTHLAPDLPSIQADRGMMEQVLMNLTLNARDAMPSGGQLTVSLEALDVDAARASAHPKVRPGRFVHLSIADSGAGISEAVRSRIFEPFFTTKGVGRGTGLGLATVFGIVQEHSGWIEVESELGQGSTFHVYLPAAEGAARPVLTPAAPGIAPRGTETILLVEDDAAVRGLACEALDRQGYRVLQASTADAALAQWKRAEKHVDLLLTDLVLPGGVSGRDLGDILLEEQPSLRVLYCTGYGDERRLTPVPGASCLEKPYSAITLAQAVRRRLDDQSAPHDCLDD